MRRQGAVEIADSELDIQEMQSIEHPCQESEEQVEMAMYYWSASCATLFGEFRER